MKRNKILAVIALLAMCMSLFTGCKNKESEGQAQDNKDKIKVVCTTFPQYDWVREIVGEQNDNYELSLLLNNGTDLHSFQPSAKDITRISSADVFIYVGGESDKWVDDVIKEASNKDLRAISLMEIMGENAKSEEIVEGMQEEPEEDAEGDSEEEEVEYDEHVWLSIKNAKIFVNEIAKKLGEVDAKDAEYLLKNSEAYIQKLDDLDKQYEETVKSAKKDTVLFGDRFPFRYMVDDYGLKYYAAFVGCSAETEASFETVTFLSGKEDELELGYILVLEKSDKKIAETIKENTKEKNQEILSMNSIQSVTESDIDSGFSYIKTMQDNLEVLKKVLN